jgi:hypothetical protein
MHALGLLLTAAITTGPYLQDVSEHGFTVVFDTDAPVKAKVTARGLEAKDTEGTHHEARFGVPQTDQRYPYDVVVDGKSVAHGEAHTLPAHGAYSFVVYGDTRQGGDAAGQLVQRIVAEQPDFVVHTGDFVRKGDDEDAWRTSFAEQAPLLSSLPFFPVLGNHEVWGDVGGQYAQKFFAALRGPRYYAFRLKNAMFIVLDGNAPGEAQTAWLHERLEEGSRTTHTFVFVHQPPFSLGDHCGSAPAQAEWVRLFEHYRVRAVFAGHDHAYERMERNGVKYFVTGGGGAPLYDEQACADYDRAAKRVYKAAYHYLRVRVRGDEVEVAALPLDGGAVMDGLVLLANDSHVAAAGLSTDPLVPPLTEPARSPLDGIGRRLTLAAGALVAVLILGRLLRRRPR